MFDEAVVGMAIVDENGVILRANNRLASLLDYTRLDLVGRTFREMTHPEDVGIDEQSFKALVDGKISDYSMIKQYRTKGDRFIRLKLHVSRMPGEDGRATIALGQISQPVMDFKDLEYFVTQISDRVAKSVAVNVVRELQRQNADQNGSRGFMAVWRAHWPTWLPWLLGTFGVLAAMMIRQAAIYLSSTGQV